MKTVAIEKSDYKIYLKKAKDLYDIMLKAGETENWTAVGLNAVHCAISCCDTMLTFYLGVRSSGEDHTQVGYRQSRLLRRARRTVPYEAFGRLPPGRTPKRSLEACGGQGRSWGLAGSEGKGQGDDAL